jgi:hypothetical protein
MLLNITPFVGYVNQLHGSDVMAGLTDPDTVVYIENPLQLRTPASYPY